MQKSLKQSAPALAIGQKPGTFMCPPHSKTGGRIDAPGDNAMMGSVVSLKGLGRVAATTAFAVAFLAMGFSLEPVSASQPAKGEGLVLVPPAKPIKKSKAVAKVPGFEFGKVVAYDTTYKRGTVIVVTGTKSLYYVLGKGRAVKYRVATAKDGFEWSGTHKVSRKVEWPDWRPPEQMRQRRPELPAFMEGGPDNPLGARAIYLGSSLYRIHGTNEPSSIGRSASSGCIRMLNEAVTELYGHIKVGDTVIVM
jgi:lipoprotein-anchoring transpeptidase ErfK/SrfK